jgi:hypothetical protein
MTPYKPPEQDAKALFLLMERDAGKTLLVLLLVATILNVLLSPGIWFVVCSVLAGLICYGLWRAGLAGRFQLGLMLVFVTLFVGFLAIHSILMFSLYERMALVFSHYGIGLYAPILFMRVIKMHEL